MKSPQYLKQQLAKQWLSSRQRELRLLTKESWPLKISIGKPSASEFVNTASLSQHIQQWRSVNVGKVEWNNVNYRAAEKAVSLPLYWIIDSPSQWIQACDDENISAEYRHLEGIVKDIDSLFYATVIRQLKLVLAKPIEEVITAAKLALQLTPGCAEGRPLRAISIAGIDSKFFERHRSLIVQFLDVRFDGAVSEQGLEIFLNASNEKDHWLLLIPLGKNLLPFEQMRVRASELSEHGLQADNILIIENEQCAHQLPSYSTARSTALSSTPSSVPSTPASTIAILGAGLNLNWLSADWLANKHIAYWGDMDSWGLKMLAQARLLQPHLKELLMSERVFLQYQQRAVIEPTIANENTPEGLTLDESEFYQFLIHCEKGRLEQEFLPKKAVEQAILGWLSAI